jgi:hypothetical protein
MNANQPIISGKKYHSVSFYDAAGDKVTVSLIDKHTNKISTKASFSISLNGKKGNHEDIDNILLSKGVNGNTALVINVIPQDLNLSTRTAGAVTVNSISADPSVRVTTLHAINLSAAIVNDIHLPNVDIGSISLNTGQAQYADRINTVTNTPITNYQPTAGAIDLGDVEAASIGAIVIKGVQAQNNRQLDFTNDLTGNINVSGRIGSITDFAGGVQGSVTAKSIGLVNVNSIGGSLTVTQPGLDAGTDTLTGAAIINYPETPAYTTSVQTGTMLGSLTIDGNLSLQVSSGFQGNVSALGHVNFAVNSGLTEGAIYGATGISGPGSDSAPINLPGSSNTSFTTSGQSESYQQGSPPATKYADTGGSISDINVNGTIGEDFSIKSAWNVGNITAQSFTGDGPTVTALGSIGNLTATSASGYLNGTFDAGQGIGNLTATKEVDGTYTARGTSSVGSITAGWGIGVNNDMSVNAQTIGNITSFFGNINGNYTAYSTELEPTFIPAKPATLTQPAVPAHYDTGLSIGNITAGTGSIYGIYTADGNIGSIDANCIAASFTSASGDIGYVQDPADPSKMIPGNIIASRRNDNAIDGAIFSAGNSIGNIYATITNPNGGVNGIANSTFVAGTYGSPDPLVTPSIGNITVNNAGTGSGIYQSAFGVDNVNGQVSNANIGNITVNCTNQDPTFGSAAIRASVFNASTQTQQYYDTLAGALTDNSTNANGNPNTPTGIYNNEGTIGNINVSALQDYYGILGSTFGAGQDGSIGANSLAPQEGINVTSGLYAIALSNFHANQPALGYAGSGDEFNGSIGNISVTSTSTDNGQVSSYAPTPVPTPANWVAGPILLPSTPGANGGGIFGSKITASGNVGNIDVNAIGYGIVSTEVQANAGSHNTAPGTGAVGNIHVVVTGAGASGITDGMYVTGLLGSGPLGNTPGPLMNVFGAVIDNHTGLLQGAIINGPDFINLDPNLAVIPSSFSGTSIGNVDVNLSAWGGNAAAISGSQFIATRNQGGNDAGTIGNITVNNSSPSADAYGINGSSFLTGAAGGIGNVAVTEAGGSAISTYSGYGLNNDIPSVFRATDTLSGQTLFSGTVGTVTVNENSMVENSPLGHGPGQGIVNGTFEAASLIGNITSSGVGNQNIILGDNNVGNHNLAVGNLNFGSISAGKALTAGFTDTLPGGSGSTKQVGNITTGAGSFIVSDGFSLDKVGTVSVGSFLPYSGSSGTPVAIGNGSEGSSIGLVTVGEGSLANTPNYVISFGQMHDVTNPGSQVLAVNFLDHTSDITTAQAASPGGYVSGGLRAILTGPF